MQLVLWCSPVGNGDWRCVIVALRFSAIVCLPFHLYCFASVFVSSLVEFNLLAAVDQPPKVTMSFSSYAMLRFFFFLLFRFCFFFSYFYNQASNHILVWQPRNWCQSWRKATGWNSPTDVQMKCRISKQLFVHSFIYSNVYYVFNHSFIYLFDNLVIVYCKTRKEQTNKQKTNKTKQKHAIGRKWLRSLILPRTEKQKLSLKKKKRRVT